jgi:hypothetical protein
VTAETSFLRLRGTPSLCRAAIVRHHGDWCDIIGIAGKAPSVRAAQVGGGSHESPVRTFLAYLSHSPATVAYRGGGVPGQATSCSEKV